MSAPQSPPRACGAVYSRQDEMAQYGVSLAPCARPADHVGLCAFAARLAAPALCERCSHPVHGGETCLVRFILGNVDGEPRMPCLRCGPGAQEDNADAP